MRAHRGKATTRQRTNPLP